MIGQPAERRGHVLPCQMILLARRLPETLVDPFVGPIDRKLGAFARPARLAVDERAVERAEQPASDAAAAAPLMMLADGPLETVLHKVVRLVPVARQRPGIAAEMRYFARDQPFHVTHAASRPIAAVSCRCPFPLFSLPS